MSKRRCPLAFLFFFFLIAALSPGPPVLARDLTLEDRVRAQEAIERVYYSHLTGASRPFEDAVAREVLDRKVRTSLKQSLALERFWSTPVTADMLLGESRRMACGTRMPERLRELHDALGDDPFLFEETVARAALVDRLSRNFYAYDQHLHAAARTEAEALRARLAKGELDPRRAQPGRTLLDLIRLKPTDGGQSGAAPGASGPAASARPARAPQFRELEPAAFDRWRLRIPRIGEPGPVVEQREGFVVQVILGEAPGELRVASFYVPKTPWDVWWSEVSEQLDERTVSAVSLASEPLADPAGQGSPSFPDPDPALSPALETHRSALSERPSGTKQESPVSASLPDDTWDNGTLDDLPDPRASHTAVWTGSVMIVWGGQDGDNTGVYLNAGGRYDPATDTWTSTSRMNAPLGRRAHTAIWTGSRMVIWGGFGAEAAAFDSGGQYDPLTDSWIPTSTMGAPLARSGHTAVWTGSRMIVWGGIDSLSKQLQTGGRYDPVSDTWTPTATNKAPSPRRYHTAVWTGSRMIVWGGLTSVGLLKTGSRYDPVSDKWSETSASNAPTARREHTAVWTGSVMIVWGGTDATANPTVTGGRYDPVADKWQPTSTMNAPLRRSRHTAVWSGSRMIIWGGDTPAGVNTGGRYDPLADSWSLTTTTNAPSARTRHTAIWSGSRMIVWGGQDIFTVNSGGRYDPVSDSWTPTSTMNQPEPRKVHTAVWTGSQMIIWGGIGLTTNLNTGSRYDPATDTFAPTSTTNAPAARNSHTAVWTGSRMIVWGGLVANTGGLYDPVGDSWAATSTTNAPEARGQHSAVWTGSRMIVWGGGIGLSFINTGGLYDPTTDTWTPTSTDKAPSARSQHTAVWTGSRMIVWGGGPGAPYINTGGLYDPTTDSWTPTSMVNAPDGRAFHSAVWTGSRMIVWGGGGGGSSWLDTGGLYDPTTDSWTPTSTTNAPTARIHHTGVWTGCRMIVWGGGAVGSTSGTDTGGRYDPVTDSWTPTSITNAASARSYHTAVWTGGVMIVWGGEFTAKLSSGGRYASGAACP